MTEKTEALRLADRLESRFPLQQAAAAELRRLSAENEAQRGTIAQFHHAVAAAGWHPGRTDDLLTDIIRDKGQELRRLHAQRNELLKALKEVVAFTGAHGGPYVQARAAIKAVEEGK